MSTLLARLGLAAALSIALIGSASAQVMPGQSIPGTHSHGHASVATPGLASNAQPSLPGQDAFGAIQEIVRILEADPNTDWSKVNLGALREHLIDMNAVTLRAVAVERKVKGGLEVLATGQGRTLDAIRRMVPAHARELDQLNGWHAKTEEVPNGVKLTVTSRDPREVVHIRGLGFIGLMASGSHHQPHHLAMARGEFDH